MRPLTERQLELLAYVASGLTADEAARRCYIQPRSAYNILSAARENAGAATTTHLALMAVREGWLEHQGRGVYTPTIPDV